MKSFKLCAALLLWVLVCISCKPQEDTAQLQQQSVKGSDTLMAKALERWHTDSLGCLHLRTAEDGDVLVHAFGLDSCNADSVISVLGKPDYTTSGPATDESLGDIQVQRYIYFFNTDCKATTPSPSSFIAFIISNANNKVVQREGGVY